MMTRLSTQLAVGLVVVGAVGCATKDGSLGELDSPSIGAVLGNGLEDSASTYGPLNSSASSVLPADTCVTLSGDTTDPDMDNIPTSATLTYNCTQTSGNLTGMLTGTLAVTDDQPTVAAWAFTGAADLDASLTGTGQSAIVVHQSGQLVATQAAATGPFGLARTVAVTTTLTGENGNSIEVDESADWTLTFTPQATWTPGALIVTGTLAAAGAWDITVGAGTASATLATPTPLTLDPSCATRVTGGTATATWADAAHSNVVTVTWTGCGAHTVTFAAQ